MSASSDSNDASELFWPGYVDAVTNLAINLLFVIAVMSIVVLSSILQISKMKPDYTIKDADAVLSKPISKESDSKAPSQSSESKNANIKEQDNNINKSLEKLNLETKVIQQSEKILRLENEISQLKTDQNSNKKAKGKKDQPGGTDTQLDPAEIINAIESKISSRSGENQLLSLSAGGLLVVFDKDVINLSAKEENELIEKLNFNNQIKNTNWLIKVNVPKGFSEASRIGYYRVNSIRNIMLKNNIDPSKITMRILESETTSANNSRILVKAIQ